MRQKIPFTSILLVIILAIGSVGIISTSSSPNYNISNFTSSVRKNQSQTQSSNSLYMRPDNPYKPFSITYNQASANVIRTLAINQGSYPTIYSAPIPKNHPPIYINSQKDLSHFPGSGTINDPYIIGAFAITSKTKDLIVIENTVSYVKIEYNLLIGGAQDINGIKIINSQNIIIENNNVTNTLAGIYVQDSSNIVINNNIISNNYGDGIQLYSSNSNIIENNTIYNNMLSGIHLSSSDSNTITSNQIYNNYQDGVFLENSNTNTLIGNNVYDNGMLGTVQVSSTVINNQIVINVFSALGAGVYLDPSFGNIVENNQVSGNTGSGIILQASGDTSINQNTIFNNAYNGLFLANSSSNGVTFNNIYGNGINGLSSLQSISGMNPNTYTALGAGFYLDPSFNNGISNNSIHDNYGAGLFLEQSGNTQVAGNTFNSNGYQGIFLQDSNYNNFEQNDIYLNGASLPSYSQIQINTYTALGAGFYLDPSIGNSISNNNVHDNYGTGLILQYCDNNNVNGNTISSNSINGVFLQDSNNNTLGNNDVYGNGNPTLTPLIGLNTYTALGAGFYLDPSYDNVLTGNNVHDNYGTGVVLYQTQNTYAQNNNIKTNSLNGVELILSNNNNVDHNNVSGNAINGLFLNSSSYNTFTSNVVNSNGHGVIPQNYLKLNTFSALGSGFYLDPSVGNVLSGNNFTANAQYGVFLEATNQTNLVSNRFESNTQYGIGFDGATFYNTADNNNFHNNHNDTKQALDNGIGNSFSHNFFSDGNNTDKNYDGISDYPYIIAGTANSTDADPSNIPFGQQHDNITLVITPTKLNAASTGTPVTADITLLNGYRALNISLSDLYLNGTINPYSYHIVKPIEFTLTFARADVNNLVNRLSGERGLVAPYNVTFEISGYMNNHLLIIDGFTSIIVNQDSPIITSAFIVAPVALASPILSKTKDKKNKLLKFLSRK